MYGIYLFFDVGRTQNYTKGTVTQDKRGRQEREGKDEMRLRWHFKTAVCYF